MRLETILFKKDFHYKSSFVNKCIKNLKGANNEKTQKGYKMFIFKMMKDVIKKNICNYINLLNGTSCREIPDSDEMISTCYIIFEKCLEKYEVSPTNNFYFYYNKSMSRNFFRYYQRELKGVNVEITESITTFSPSLRTQSEPDMLELIMDNFQFSYLDKKIVYSRMNGQKTSEFLEENTDISNGQYSRSLKKIKETLTYYKEKGEL